MNKKFMIALTLCTTILCTAIPCKTFADNDTFMNEKIGEPRISVDGQKLDLESLGISKYVFKTNDELMVPIRPVAEAMNYNVEWDGENRSVTLSNDERQMIVYIDKDTYATTSKLAIGMTAPKSYGVVPQIFEDRTFVPAKMFELIDYNYETFGAYINFKKNSVEDSNNTQLSNPFKEYESLSELSEAVGFNVLEIRAIPFNLNEKIYSGTEDGLAQISYNIGGDKKLLFRQSKGSGDNSGDYNEYKNSKVLNNQDLEITLKGNDNEKYNLVLWESDGYSFSIHTDEALDDYYLFNMIDSLN
jgi:Copper amine oxidase N-terminal domain.